MSEGQNTMSDWIGNPITLVEYDPKTEKRRKVMEKHRRVRRSITYSVLFAFKNSPYVEVITEVDRETGLESEINGDATDTCAISLDGISVKDYSLQKFRQAFHNFYFFEDRTELWS